MFFKCYNIKYIDLSNIDTSLVATFESTFFQTESAEIINLYSFKIKNDANYDALFLDLMPKYA
jgi:surface protein